MCFINSALENTLLFQDYSKIFDVEFILFFVRFDKILKKDNYLDKSELKSKQDLDWKVEIIKISKHTTLNSTE